MLANNIINSPEELSIYMEQRIDRSGGIDACHNWKLAPTPAGYGHTIHTVQRAHRLAYLMEHGSIPELTNGMPTYICHHCDNKLCCNYRHLYAGNARTNSDDMMNRNRLRNPAGELSVNAKLTNNQVRVIRLLAVAGCSQYKLAAQYKVAQGSICRILNRQRYVDVM